MCNTLIFFLTQIFIKYLKLSTTIFKKISMIFVLAWMWAKPFLSTKGESLSKMTLTQRKAELRDGENLIPGDVLWTPGSSHTCNFLYPWTYQLHSLTISSFCLRQFELWFFYVQLEKKILINKRTSGSFIIHSRIVQCECAKDLLSFEMARKGVGARVRCIDRKKVYHKEPRTLSYKFISSLIGKSKPVKVWKSGSSFPHLLGFLFGIFTSLLQFFSFY